MTTLGPHDVGGVPPPEHPDLRGAAKHRGGAARGRARTEVHYLAPDAVEWMYRHAESVIYPSRDTTRRPAGGDRLA